MATNKVAFIGLGVMGYPMAGHLVNKGYKVNVFNRTISKAEKWSKNFKVKFHIHLVKHVQMPKLYSCVLVVIKI